MPPDHPSEDVELFRRIADGDASAFAAVYDRYAVPIGTVLEGPAVFEENESTFIVGPGARITVLPDGAILAEHIA